MVSGHNNLSPFSNRQHTPQQQHQQPFIDGMSPSTSTGYVQQNRVKPMTLEDLEADMQRQAAHRYRQNEPAAKVMSLAELEATLASNRPAQASGMPPAPPFGYPQPDPMQILAMKQQQELKEQQLSIARELKRRENYRKVTNYKKCAFY